MVTLIVIAVIVVLALFLSGLGIRIVRPTTAAW